MLSGNKIAKSAINLLKLGMGYKLSKDLIKVMKDILSNNGIKGGYKMKNMKNYKPMNFNTIESIKLGGSKVKVIQEAALNLFTIALGFELSKAVLNEIEKILVENKS
jgi:lipoate-protein ligase A